MFMSKPPISVRSVLALDKTMSWWKTHRPQKRKIVQLYAALLYNANIRGFVDGTIFQGVTKNVCVPGFNCYSCPGAVGACPLGALQNALASSGHRLPYYVLGILALFGLVLGRTICGWLCPLGLIQELLHKLPTPKLKKSRTTRKLSYLKYVILAVFVVAVPLYYATKDLPVPGFCKYICPAGTLEGAGGLLSGPAGDGLFPMLGSLFTRKLIIAIVIFTACVFIYRAFCRFLCPLGAIYGFFSRIALLGVRVDESRCTGCGLCVAKCRMDIRHVGDHECIHCGDCISSCGSKAISMKAGQIQLMGGSLRKPAVARKTSRGQIIARICAVVLLTAVLCYANFIAPRTMPAPEASAAAAQDVLPDDDTPLGNEVGQRLPDFTLPVVNREGESFTLSNYRGKPVVINVWATWCVSCVKELPDFERFGADYDGRVPVIAIHSNFITDSPEEFLSKNPYNMPFAVDTAGDVMTLLGVTPALPQTLIVDPKGIVVYNQSGSMNYAKLESLVAPLLEPAAH